MVDNTIADMEHLFFKLNILTVVRRFNYKLCVLKKRFNKELIPPFIESHRT